MSPLRRHPLLAAAAALVLAVAIGVPVVAYVVVPALVRSTLVEELPVAPRAPATGTAGASAAPASLETLARGELVRISAADYGTGVVRIVKVGEDRVLRFDNVDIAGAPDMYVYLSDRADGKPGNYVDLGKLRATTGSFNYPLPAGVDLARTQSLVIWCRQFSVTVTYAVLARP